MACALVAAFPPAKCVEQVFFSQVVLVWYKACFLCVSFIHFLQKATRDGYKARRLSLGLETISFSFLALLGLTRAVLIDSWL